MAKYIAFDFDMLASSKVYRSHIEATDAAKYLNGLNDTNRYVPVRIIPRMTPQQCLSSIFQYSENQSPKFSGDLDDLYA